MSADIEKKRQELQQRVGEFDKELTALMNKYRIQIMPHIAYTPQGILAQIQYYDKDELDAKQTAGPAASPIKG